MNEVLLGVLLVSTFVMNKHLSNIQMYLEEIADSVDERNNNENQ